MANDIEAAARALLVKLDNDTKDHGFTAERTALHNALHRAALAAPASGAVEEARIVAWAMCRVSFGHDDTAARPALLFDTKEKAEDVARRQTAFGVGAGGRFIVRPITWAAERAERGGKGA